MLCWLPMSLMASQLVSVNMLLDEQQTSAHPSDSCHENSNQQHNETHKCSVCGSCIFANASATVNSIAFINELPVASQKHFAFEPSFSSISTAPAIKPPILN
jgi:succinate dehydrogenase/fumarate reductase-like Fe-S protein